MRKKGLMKRLFVLALCMALTVVSFAGFSEEEQSHEHSWSATETVPPTCTEDGYTLYVCSTCDATEKRSIAASGHSWKQDMTIDATCETDGYTLFICLACGETEQRDPVPALGHDWIEGDRIEPTCVEDGGTVYTCSRCGATELHDVITAPGHAWKETAIYVPSCDTVGYTEYVCTVCGEKKADNQVLPLGHDWTEWAVSVEPTCTQTGLESRTCNQCGKVESHVLPTGHKWDEEGVCEICGERAIARIGEIKYTSLQAAVEAVQEDEVIVLLADAACELPENRPVRIDANGFKLELTVPEGCMLTQEGDTFTAVKAYAETGGVTYISLADAVAAAEPDGIVTVLADEIGGGIVIDKNLTIDFGGFTYTARNPGGPKENPEDPSQGAAFELLPGVHAELKNGAIKGSGNAKYLIQNNSDKLKLTDMTLNALLNANLKFALSNNRGEIVLAGATAISGGVGQWAIDLWRNEDERVTVTLDESMTGTVAGYVRIYPDSQVVIVGSGYRLVEKGIDEATECPYYCIAIVVPPTPSPTATPTPTPKPTATPTPTPTATPTPKPTSSGGGGGSGSGSSSGGTEESDLEGDTGTTDSDGEGNDKGIVDYSLEIMRAMAGFLSGGMFDSEAE